MLENTNRNILFANITMMDRYCAEDMEPDYKFKSGGKFVVEHQEASEHLNFKDFNDRTYGFVRVADGKSMRIERICPSARNQDSIQNVLVVWTAVSPVSNSRVIVGWYKDATVYREEQEFTIDPFNIRIHYRVSARTQDVVLLPMAERTYAVPSALYSGAGKGMGRSNIWYANELNGHNDFLEHTFAYIDKWQGKRHNVGFEELISQPMDRLFSTREEHYENSFNVAEPDQALLHIRQAIRMAPESEKNMLVFDYASALHINLYFDRALTELEKHKFENMSGLSQIDIDHLKADVLFAKGRYKAAEILYESVMEERPDDFYCTYLLACCYACQENYESALEMLRKARTMTKDADLIRGVNVNGAAIAASIDSTWN